MGTCSGHCGACSGCARELVLSQPEIDFLRRLGQYAFLPVARRWDSETPVYLEEGPAELYSAAITGLQLKRLIRVDYDLPLLNFDYAAYGAYPCRGSMALTERGQAAVELLEIQSAEP